jgi:gamma-glutamyltranspeptidase/glutathione hydrolase
MQSFSKAALCVMAVAILGSASGCQKEPAQFAVITPEVTPESKSIDKVISYFDINHPVVGRKGMVASQSAIASEIGAEVLRQGGNAVDAAVAMGYALTVVLPRAGNLTGGGFMLVYLPKQQKTIAIDYRESAPAASSHNMFLDKHNKVDQFKVLESLSASGVPGTVMGLEHALKHYGTMKLSQLIQPSIDLASQGFNVTDDMVRIMAKENERLSQNPETCRVFFKENCKPYQTGDVFVQKDLANTLVYLSEQGAKGFYEGDIATKIVAAMERGNGLITQEDLAHYEVDEVTPLKGSFNGYDIFTMPPPSSGGVHLIQMLNMFATLPLDNVAQGSANLMHYQTEIFKRAYADRSVFLGDPDFVEMPLAGLMSDNYAIKSTQQISGNRITPSSEIALGNPAAYESPDTTHFSVIDSKGMMVSNTYTLNHYYGNGITIEGTGLLMNNTMDDFSAKPGTPNSYGLVGGEANAIAPNKKPLSSMTPTLILKDGKPFLATGTPGGSKIITTVFQQLVNILWFYMNISEATNAPRIHHQWQPDILFVEQNIPADTIERLQNKGYQLEISTSLGSLQTVMFNKGLYYGASDPRRPNAKAVAVN